MYCILGYEQSGACRVAETLVEVQPGAGIEVVLHLRLPATLELRPPIGAIEATSVTLRRGDVHVVSFGQNPILPTPIALAPGPVIVSWRTASGARRSRTVELTAGATVTVELDD